MVQLIINNTAIELPKGISIKYNKQISDIFDLSNVSCSYTNSFEFEKTPINTQAMQFLGISGDSSNIPYQKNTSFLKVQGFDLISKGWFNISNTDETYKGSILDGMVDFFKSIENKTMGVHLDLSNFEHTKDLNSVVESFDNDYYNYIIADYGGKTMYQDGINIDYLAPCFSVKKLWDLIFSTFGFNCDYTHLNYLDGLYITYPKDISGNTAYDLIAKLTKNPYSGSENRTPEVGGYVYLTTPELLWDVTEISEGSIALDGYTFIIPETGSYNFNLEIEMYAGYHKSKHYDRRLDVTVNVFINGVINGSLLSSYEEGDTVGAVRTLDFNLGCDAGDKVYLQIQALNRRDFGGSYYYFRYWNHYKTIFKISKSDLGTTGLSSELKDFSIKDFVKEIIWRTGLTPVFDKETNTVDFIPLDDRVNFSLAQDLSDCFVQRKGEIYQNDYAQRNVFKLKSVSDIDTEGDGYLYVPNLNIEDQKIIAQSKIYAPDKKILTEFIGFSTNQYKIWESEVKTNDAGDIEITYKGLSGRFYFIRKKVITGSFKLISEKLVDDVIVSSIPVGINTNTLFEEAIYNNYSEYQKIFINFRIHTIQLALSVGRFLGMDLTRPFYFKQENAYYICNKVDFQEGQFSTGEFVKINKQ